jgi:hypothetical protein
MADMLGGQEEVPSGGCERIVFWVLLGIIIAAGMLVIISALGRLPMP